MQYSPLRRANKLRLSDAEAYTADISEMLITRQRITDKYRWMIVPLEIVVVMFTLFLVGSLTYLYAEIPEFDFQDVDFKQLPVYNISYLQPFDPIDYNVVLEPHAHTLLSDGRLTVQQVLEWAISQGFTAIVLSDHNNYGGYQQALKLQKTNVYLKQVTVVKGFEYSCCRIHMNIYGASLNNLSMKVFPTDEDLRQVIQQVHEEGGLISVNHIPWSTTKNQDFGTEHPSLVDHPTIQQLHDWGIDYVEVVNGVTMDLPSLQFAQKNGLGIITGNDLHFPGPSFSWTVLKAANNSEKGIMDAMRQKQTSFLFDARGSYQNLSVEQIKSVEPRMTKLFKFIQPIAGVGQYLNIFYQLRPGMASFQGPRCYENDVQIYSETILFWFVWVSIWTLFFVGAKKLVVMLYSKVIT